MPSLIPDISKSHLSEDKFHRENLVDVIVDAVTLLSQKEHECTCIGIYGKWGEGKTTLLNFIRQRLVEHGDEDKIIISQFNPWIISGERALLQEFFKSISKGSIDENTRDFLIKYGNLISFSSKYIINTVIPGLGAGISNFIDNAKEAVVGTEPSISDQKANVVNSIKESRQHLLVFIDDIDRLDAEEMHALFRLIRQVADFPNTIYVVALDPDIVSKSLSKYYGGNEHDGRAFLDKIIQIPIQLPILQQRTLQNELKSHLEAILSPDNNYYLEEINAVCEQLISVIQTPRQIIRYVNQISLIFPRLKDEVNLFDLLFLEVIKFLNPKAYHHIYNCKESLLQNQQHLPHNDNQKEAKEKYDKAVSQILEMFNADIRDSINKILTKVFPQFQNKDYITNHKRAQCEVFFPIYFICEVPEGIMSSSKMEEIISDIESSSIEKTTTGFNHIYDNYGINELQRCIYLAMYRTTPRNCAEKISKISIALSRTSIAIDYRHLPVLQGGVHNIIYVLLERYLHYDENEDEIPDRIHTASQILHEIYSTANINFSLNLNTSIQHSYRYRERLEKNHICPLVEKFLKLPYQEQQAYSQYTLDRLFAGWRKCNSSGLINYLKKAMDSTDFDLPRFVHKQIEDGNDPQYIASFVGNFKDKELLEMICDRLEHSTLSDGEKLAYNVLRSNYEAFLNMSNNP